MNALRFQFTLAARYLLGRRLRTTLTTLAVVFGVTAYFALNQIVPALSATYRRNLLMSAGQVDLTVSHVTSGSFRATVADTVRGTLGVAAATGMLRRTALLPSATGTAGTAVGVVGIDPATALTIRSYPLTTGRLLSEADVDGILIPASLAEKLGLTAGGTLTLPSASGTIGFRIAGVLTDPPAAGPAEVFVPLDAAQRLFDQPGQINVVEALFTPGADEASIIASIQDRLGAGYRIGGLEAGGEMAAALKANSALYGVFGLMALLMGAFIIHITFRTVVVERRHDFGMLRAVGATRRTILGLTLAESVTQGVLGSAVGLLLGYALSTAMFGAMRKMAQQYIHLDTVVPAPSLSSVATALLLGVGITVAGALMPAFSATRVTPLEALRPSPSSDVARVARRGALVGLALLVIAAAGLFSGQPGFASAGATLVLIGMVLIAPALVRPAAGIFGRLIELAFAREGQIAEGNLARQPDRAAITASTMMVGLAVGIALLGIISSFMAGFTGYLERSFAARFLVMPSSLILGGGNVGAGTELARSLREIPGMGKVTTLRRATAEIGGASVQLIGIEPEGFQQLSGLVFSHGEPGPAYAAIGRERAIILNGILAFQLKANVGDTLTVRTPEGDFTYRVAGVGIDYLNAKLATGIISQANLATDFHETTDVLLMASPAPGADGEAVRRAAERAVSAYPAFSLLDSTAFKDSQIELFQSIMTAMYGMLVAVALPGLIGMINTLAINVIERTREIGTLRAVGMTRRQVRRMILSESLILSAIGTAFGILAGLWLGYAFVGGLSAFGYPMPFDFPWAGILAALAVGLLVGVVAALIPARQAARLPIVAALRYE